MPMRAMLAATCFPLALSLTPADYARLDAGEPVVSVLPAQGRDVAIRAATAISADPARLIGWTRRIDELQKGPHLLAIGRFSTPPNIDDLAGLVLDEEDLNDLRRCRPGSCGVKLSDKEIVHMRAASAEAVDWRAAAQNVFRDIVLARAQRYLAEGHGNTASYHDERKRVMLDTEFAALASEVALSHPSLFPLTNYLSLYPTGVAGGIESFLYWSKETLGAKPIVGITHVAMTSTGVNGSAGTVVAKKQVYATHYILASLSFTAVSAAPEGHLRYLIYLNHSRADVFDGIFGGFIRGVIERRLRAEGPRALETLRMRLESAEPSEGGKSWQP
jgi:hypothetical protein